MNKSLKILLPILIAVVAIVTTVLLIVFLGGGSKVDGISVKEDMQLQYVSGESLDLSKMLVVTSKGESVEIPLNSEGVTVSGYDKDKLGEQTVTIEYKGQTTTITVTVVPRITVSEYVADYLIGDSFNSTKGRLKITRNDGSTFTVPLSNSAVTINGFNSSAAGSLALTARYATAEAEYTVNFNVNVHAIESVELRKPNKVSYNSHEGGLDVAGGILTLKGNGGKLSKDVTITANMVSGFDISAVDENNPSQNQTLTVTYNDGTKDYTATYDVKLVYTDISLFNKKAKDFTTLVWTGAELPTISPEQGKLALEMMDLYLNMSKSEKGYISTADALSVARAAIAYGVVEWTEEFEKYSDLLEISNSGTLEFVCESYSAVKNAIDGIKNTESPLYKTAPIINKLADTFGTESLTAELTFADCLVIEPSTLDNMIAEIEYMIGLYEKFDEIPENWASGSIQAYEDKIVGIYSYITDSLYNTSSASQLYIIVSSWREQDDAFDILYSYYIEKDDMESVTTLAALRLPAELQELFDSIAGAFNQINQISSMGVFDTSGFFYYYYKAVELSANIKEIDNATIKHLYDTLSLNGLIGITDSSVNYTFSSLLEYCRTANNGSYQYYSASMLGVKKYEELLDAYIETLTKLLEQEGFADTAEYGEEIKALFNMYVALSPTQQLNFLSAVNAYYNYGYPPLAFDDTGDYAYMTSMFSQILNQYFRSKLPTDAADAAYDNLVLAMEIYAQRASYENWLDEFKIRMDNVISAYNAMSLADKAIFDQYLSAAYEKYTAIRARYGASAPTVDLGDWAVAFDALEGAIIDFDNAYLLLEEGIPVYNLLFSAYERATAIVDNLIKYAPEDILNAYYHDELYVIPASASGDGKEYSYTYEYMMNLYRGIYVDAMCGFFSDSANYFDAYNELGLAKFLNTSYELVWTFAWEYAFGTQTTTPPVFNKDNSIAVLEAFRALDRDAQVLFLMMEGDYGIYYTAVAYFIEEAFTGDAKEVANKMIELEQQMLISDPEDATALETLASALAELEAMHSALTGDDAASFAVLENVYADIVSDCRALAN